MASGDVVKLNIGGKVFHTTRSTLTKYDGYFRMMFESRIPPSLDDSGCIFIDRSPENFDLVLNFLRDGEIPIPDSEFQKGLLLKEAEYYALDGLIYLCGGQPSEEWKKVNVDSKYLRDWRGANLRAEIQVMRDMEDRKDFVRYCRDKLALHLAYSAPYWGDIHQNPLLVNFVRKYSKTWNILFFQLEERGPKCIIRHPDQNSFIDCTYALPRTAFVPRPTCEEYMKSVESCMEKYSPE